MDDRINQIRARKKLDDGIREYQRCIGQFISANLRYLSWMPRAELECLLMTALWTALWTALRKWDDNAEEERDFYLVFWWEARQELGHAWRVIAKQLGRTRSILYTPDFQNNVHVHDDVERVFTETDPMYLRLMGWSPLLIPASRCQSGECEFPQTERGNQDEDYYSWYRSG